MQTIETTRQYLISSGCVGIFILNHPHKQCICFSFYQVPIDIKTTGLDIFPFICMNPRLSSLYDSSSFFKIILLPAI